jgi:hypothetical protein
MQRSRDRDFSHTRLSYSRHTPLSTDRPALSPSRRTPHPNPNPTPHPNPTRK